MWLVACGLWLGARHQVSLVVASLRSEGSPGKFVVSGVAPERARCVNSKQSLLELRCLLDLEFPDIRSL